MCQVLHGKDTMNPYYNSEESTIVISILTG